MKKIETDCKRPRSLACMFRFPNTGHVTTLYTIVSFNFRVLRVLICVLFMKKQRVQVPLGPLLGKQN